MHRVPYTSTVSLFTSPRLPPSTLLDISLSLLLPPSLCLAPGWIRAFLLLHPSFSSSICLRFSRFFLHLPLHYYYRVSRHRVLSLSLSSLFPAPIPFSSLSRSLVRPRPPSRPIMLPYCLGILSLTPKPVQIASGFARTCMSAPLSVRLSFSFSLGTRKGRKDVNLMRNNRKR